MHKFDNVTLISGQIYEDSRGSVAFNNNLDISGFRRMYLLTNSESLPLRGWHGHVNEAKIFTCLSGSVEVAAVRIDDWASPSKSLSVEKFKITAGTLDAVFVPAGYANAVRSNVPGSQVQVLSSSTLEDSRADDFRYPSDFWLI